MTTPVMKRASRPSMAFLVAGLVLALLVFASIIVGSHSVGWRALVADDGFSAGLQLLEISRLPRTLALILCGSALSVSGLIMQMLTQNRFVEPATAGSMQGAALGMLLIAICMPGAPLWLKMLLTSGGALCATGLFLFILNRLSLHATLIVPLVGLMLGAVISAITTFIAVHFEMLQSLSAWTSGDFSGILRGRYELLWVVGLVTVAAFVIADRFAVAGMGRQFATNLGLNYKRTLYLGMTMVAIISGVVVSAVGILPFLGLIVPNVVRLIRGDNVRQNLPWIAIGGAGLVLLCDLAGRLIIYPFELPTGTLLGVIGAVVFLVILLRGQHGASNV